jgi:hypothetical protein
MSGLTLGGVCGKMMCASGESLFLLFAHPAHSSSGLGHRPLKAKITGSNPVCATNPALGSNVEGFVLPYLNPSASMKTQ